MLKALLRPLNQHMQMDRCVTENIQLKVMNGNRLHPLGYNISPALKTLQESRKLLLEDRLFRLWYATLSVSLHCQKNLPPLIKVLYNQGHNIVTIKYCKKDRTHNCLFKIYY